MSEAGRQVFVYPERHATVRGIFLILIYGVGAKMLFWTIVAPNKLPAVISLAILGFFAWLLTSLFSCSSGRSR